MQLIKGKPSGQQKYLRYFIGIIASTFRVGTGGCADWSASSGCPGCRGCDGVFPIIIVLQWNEQPFKVVSSTSSIPLIK